MSAIVRIEQLYPFPHKAMQEVVAAVCSTSRICLGARKSRSTRAHGTASQHHFREVNSFGASRVNAPPGSASPAVGYMSVFTRKQQQDLLMTALNVE
ncbi:hypothetical protein LAD67_09995 [Escherichia coli]|nr:hypothetical protein [Escherichia coli]